MGSTSVNALSDTQLLERLDDLARRERRATVAILMHLAQADRRRAWAGLGHSSTYDYCRRRLRYSESGANRRIRTARVIARHPEVAARLVTGRVTLCAISRVARLVLERRKDALLEQIEGKRLDQIDAIVASFRPRHQPVPDRIQVMTVERAPTEPAPTKPEPTVEPDTQPTLRRHLPHQAIDDTPPEPDDDTQEMSPPQPTTPAKSEHALPKPQQPPSPPSQQQSQPPSPPRIERYFKFAFAVDAGAMARFTRVQAIASSRVRRSVGLAEVFDLLCDTYLERHDPVRRALRRQKKEQPVETTRSDSSQNPSRHIPIAVRDRIFQRDGGRCTFVAPDGTRCQATESLQIDHIHPFAAGGANDPANLRLLCPVHNRLAAERYFGRDVIDRRSRRSGAREGETGPEEPSA
jgi:5-methylcytosine-specific restriction endonuclease McrA